LETWYDKVSNIPLIEMGDAYPYCDFAFHDKADRARLEAYQLNYVYVNRETWRELIGERREP
jgi:hypothetical protein